MSLLEAALVIAGAIGLAVIFWQFAHDTTGRFIRTWLMIRMLIFGILTILFAVFFIASGALPLMLAGAFLLFTVTLFILYDPRLKSLRGRWT